MTGDALGVVAATTLASGVEFVEALTIVLAMGTTRGWRSTWAGVGAALVALAVITALAGYAMQSWLPEALLQLVVGTLLLIFGLQWLRKAILRSAGLKALHDEEDAFRSEVEAARAAGDERRLGLDWFAFVVSFKGVFLEGLEIVFIVITFGLNADSIWLAVARRRDRRGHRARRRLRAAQAAGPRAREHDQVRGRPAAEHLRDVLGRRGPRLVRPRRREPAAGRAATRPCWSCSPLWCAPGAGRRSGCWRRRRARRSRSALR